MPRRIEIELTSSRDDGTWTWRAAGAREPKGTLPGSLLEDGAKVGDILKVDADFFVDGIQIVGVVAGKAARPDRGLLEITGSGRDDEPLVTTTLARPERGARRDGPPRERREGGRDGRPGGSRDGAPRWCSP